MSSSLHIEFAIESCGESEAKEATDNIQPQPHLQTLNSKDTTNLVGLNVIFFGVDVEMDN